MKQLLDIFAFAIFKRQLIAILTSFPQKNGMRMPVKSDIACIVRDSYETVFTPVNISTSSAGTGIFTVDKEKAVNTLSVRGTKRKEQSFNRAPLADLPALVNDQYIEDGLDHRVELNLHGIGHTVASLRVNKVFSDGYLQEKERTVRPTIRRSLQGVTSGDLLTTGIILAVYEAADKKEEEETAKP